MKGLAVKPLVATAAFLMVLLSLNALTLQGVQAQDQLSVSVTITTEDAVNHISGIVTDQNQVPVENAEVSIQVNDPSGETIHLEFILTDQNGEFRDSFKTPEGANGECTIYIITSKPGYLYGVTTNTFTAIPEFSTTLTVAFISILLVLFVLRKKGSK